jgi:UDP-4-amino-4,6-dideoxy-L-N-acetyl-beta-L-altrosamine transaminase
MTIDPNHLKNRILDEEKASGFERSETGQCCDLGPFPLAKSPERSLPSTSDSSGGSGLVLPYAHHAIDEQDVEAVSQVMRQNWITRGPVVERFEKAVCDYVQAQYAVAFVNGSAALYAAFQAADVSVCDRTITTPNTFIATAAAAARLGSRVSLVDIDQFGNVDIDQMLEASSFPSSRGRPILVPVHFAGVAVDMKRLSEHLSVPDVVVIEDAAHAFGSKYPSGEMVGSCAFSDMTIFSFHASKNITCGEGGMVTTNNPRLYEKLKMLRDSGLKKDKELFWTYDCQALSCNYHMNEPQAALGLSQLSKIDRFRFHKQECISRYRQLLMHIPGVESSSQVPDALTHYHLFVAKVRFDELGIAREKVMKSLLDAGIQTQYHYVPLYEHTALRPHLASGEADFVGMREHKARALTLPLFASMTEHDVSRVCAELQKALFF